VIVDLEFADKRGTFFGTVALKNTKEDFGLMLVQNGLAGVSVFGNKAPENIEALEAAQETTQTEEVGIWQKGLQVGASAGASVKYDERVSVLMTDITDARKFYIRLQDSASDYAKIEGEMGRFNPAKAEDLEKPVKKGTICAARFKLDDCWYRAKVLTSVGKGDYEVQFLDFGNVEVVNGSTGDLKRLPESLLQYEP
jgi:staphylococcal nuclease domain-containing protein 1